ncbi:NERD domain-containing protein [Bradyrhizobium yuanmingense]|uniref:NERD domain-containing protein n=1 Tax=Bradyrhizobium yuanmingense TaxID=108015 RepID=UPI0023B8D9DB|nr:NERD domain-containing protein [Bradyrhizobium yuanmingense]MDF0498265.1 NERD domain-containing protein [Bradyrhizobium yuanmingense]
MAILIPSLGFARFDSRGELRLAERLKDFLEENAVVWHNLPVGPRNRHPDFIIIHPANGLLVLEVKDWRLETIVSADKTKVELLTSRGAVRESNPLEQARKYTFEVVRTLERDGQLLFPPGHRLAGRSIVPFGFGAVFTNITRKQFDRTDLKEVFSEHLCLFKDEMTEGADPEEFRSKLWRMVHPRLEEPLSMPQFDRLRALLFPEVRIRQIALPLDDAPRADSSDRTLAVMDLHQEQFARSLGEGHRIIRGVAGSGKTLILAFRAEYLARAAAKPVLILCYANGIAGRLEDAMQSRGVEDRVQVLTFHSWCYRMLRTYGIAAPSERDYPDYAERLAASVSEVVKAVDHGHIPAEQYDAVLMVVYDDIQAIYKGRERPVWSQLGIEAKGRTTVLKVNYRNTAQIVAFARRFAADVIGAPGITADDEHAILLPEDAGRQGLEPDVRRCVSIDAEAHCVAEWFLDRRKAGYEWSQMACLYPEHWIGGRVAQILSGIVRRSTSPRTIATAFRSSGSPCDS